MGTYRYPAEFRADAVALVRSSGRPIAQVARELGVNHETLRHRVHTTEQAEQPEAVAESAKDAELARLRKEVAELKLDNGPDTVDPLNPGFWRWRALAQARSAQWI